MFRLILLGAVTILLGQTGEPRGERMRLALGRQHPTSEELRAVRSERVTQALRSPEALWTFVTSPETFYLERRAAALQSKELIPVTWLPQIWQAVGELRRERGVDQFGLKPHPLDSMARFPGPPVPRVPRRILGSVSVVLLRGELSARGQVQSA